MTDHHIFYFSVFPTLTTERLVLRQTRLSDALDVLVFRRDPEVQRYNGPIFGSVDEAQALIRGLHDEYNKEVGISWGITFKEKDRVVGLFGFHGWNRYHRRSDIGYDLARAYWGQGIASEALRAILDFGFERMHLNRVEAETNADNHESVRLLDRLGFQREGTRRSCSWDDDGTFHAEAIYGLLRDEWTTSASY